MATDVETMPPEVDSAPAEPDGLYEVVDGRMVEKVMGAYEVHCASVLMAYLAHFVMERGLGRAEMELLFRIDPARGLRRRPDVSFVSTGRWPLDREVPRTEAWEVVPDLAVEVVSPSNGATDVAEKVGEYLRAGVRLIWVVYPLLGEVHVRDSPRSAQILGAGDTLDGGEVIPGFRLPLSRLFETGPAA